MLRLEAALFGTGCSRVMHLRWCRVKCKMLLPLPCIAVLLSYFSLPSHETPSLTGVFLTLLPVFSHVSNVNAVRVTPGRTSEYRATHIRVIEYQYSLL